MDVRAVIADIDGIILDAGILENIAQPGAGPFCTGDGTDAPLVALGGRVEFRAAVTAAFELDMVGVGLELLLQFVDRQRVTDFLADSPSIVSVQVAASSFSGGRPLLRTNIFS